MNWLRRDKPFATPGTVFNTYNEAIVQETRPFVFPQSWAVILTRDVTDLWKSMLMVVGTFPQAQTENTYQDTGA